MKTLKSYCESLLVDDPDIDDYGALARASYDQWGDPNQLDQLQFAHVGDALEIDCTRCRWLNIYDFDALCSIGVKNIRFVNAGSVQLEGVSNIKDMNIELQGHWTCLYFARCKALTIENTSLSASLIKFGSVDPKSLACKLQKTNIKCGYIRFNGLNKLLISGSTIQAEGLFVTELFSGHFRDKVSKIDIGMFTSTSKRRFRTWENALANFPDQDKEIELLELDVEKLLGFKSNNFKQLKRIAIGDVSDRGLLFFKRGLGALPLSSHGNNAECAGPWEVTILKNVEKELPLNYQYH